MVANTIGTFMSLTVHCAQCHNHKFDPIPQEDYYRLQAVFAAIDRADKGVRPRPGGRGSGGPSWRGGYAGVSAVARRRPRPSRSAGSWPPLPPPRLVYAGTVHTGTGTFVGTGAAGGKPRPIHVLPARRRDEARQGGRPRRDRRDPRARRPLRPAAGPRRGRPPGGAGAVADRPATTRSTWRIIVNRVWQYHFGRGLVDTPNDFGKMGQLPTHPELLDWLAAEFRDSGQSLKKLHRLIVTSATYRQVVGRRTPAFETVDADNAISGGMNRRKLEAEAVRDAILAVAGKLDLTMGGPSFQDFVIEKPEHSPHYQYHLHDPDDPKSHRRSVYRFVVRSKPQPFMAALDCADPSLAVDKRNETLTPQQALALLNNQLTVAMAKHFAARVEKLADDDAGAGGGRGAARAGPRRRRRRSATRWRRTRRSTAWRTRAG